MNIREDVKQWNSLPGDCGLPELFLYFKNRLNMLKNKTIDTIVLVLCSKFVLEDISHFSWPSVSMWFHYLARLIPALIS